MVSPATASIQSRMWPTLLANHGVLITYDREEVGYPLKSVKGRRGIEVTSGDGLVTAIVDEWFFTASDMIDLVEPRRGDRILWEGPLRQPIISELYLAPGTRHWSYVDPEGVIIQVFTIQVAQ